MSHGYFHWRRHFTATLEKQICKTWMRVDIIERMTSCEVWHVTLWPRIILHWESVFIWCMCVLVLILKSIIFWGVITKEKYLWYYFVVSEEYMYFQNLECTSKIWNALQVEQECSEIWEVPSDKWVMPGDHIMIPCRTMIDTYHMLYIKSIVDSNGNMPYLLPLYCTVPPYTRVLV